MSASGSSQARPAPTTASAGVRGRRRARAIKLSAKLPLLAIATLLLVVPTVDATPPRVWPALATHSRVDSADQETGGGITWLRGNLPDRAPSGLPDFSQCRPAWSRPGSPGQWTHAGPVAAAAALWWIDSFREGSPQAPPAIADTYPLVTRYPVFGPARDDHAESNLSPLIEDLAVRFNTEGLRERNGVRGTLWEELVAGLTEYLEARGLRDEHLVDVRHRPSQQWLQAAVEHEDVLIVAIGIWEESTQKRVGGHYAAVAGGGEVDGAYQLALSDPLDDRITSAGRRMPEGSVHSCRESPGTHDDPAVVSHDAYALTSSLLPEGRLVLEGYLGPANRGEAAAFAGQNGIEALFQHVGSWSGGLTVAAVDAALSIKSVSGGVPTATADHPTPSQPASTPAQTASATATPESATPTAWTPATNTSPTVATAPATPTASSTSDTGTSLPRATVGAETPTYPAPATWTRVVTRVVPPTVTFSGRPTRRPRTPIPGLRTVYLPLAVHLPKLQVPDAR